MRFSFVILLDDINMVRKKITAINKINNSQIIVVGPEEYKSLFKNYVVDDLTNYGSACNKAMELVKGNYVNFSFASSYVPSKSLNKVKRYANKFLVKKALELSVDISNTRHKKLLLDAGTLNIAERPSEINLVIDSYFFPVTKIIKFNEKLGNFALADLIIKTLNLGESYFRFYNDYVSVFTFDTTNPKSADAYNIEWYTDFLNSYVLDLLKKHDGYYIKYVCYYLILVRFIANANASDKMVLEGKDLDEFLEVSKKCLKYIPNEVILNLKHMNIPNNYSDAMILLKDNKFYEKCSSDFIRIKALEKSINVCAINNSKDELIFDLEYDGLNYLKYGFSIVAKLDKTEIPIYENHIFSENHFFGMKVKEKYTFQVKCLKNKLKNGSVLSFYLKDTDTEQLLHIGFNNQRIASRMNNMFTNTYWKYENNSVLTSDRKCIYFRKMNPFQRFVKEIKLYKDFIFQSKKKKLGVQALALRIIYRLTRPFYKGKHIWITFDKLYKGGDNGEYFYQYCLNNKDGIRCYYIINRDAYDYKRLKRNKYVVAFKSLREYLAVLNSECVFATHAGASNFMAFTRGKEKYFRDIMEFDLFCLQHGLTIQDIPHLQNRLRDNTKLYFCASPNEFKNLLQEKYDYSIDVLKETGIPRYDGLKNNDKRQILITPTWRSNMANTKTVIGETRPYYEDFKNTEYFKIFNSVINDKKLIEAAKKYNYRISYLLHPTLTSQIDDFDKNDYVDIFTVTEDQSYEKLLTESSLMVTDYSGVQYDFAYMRKPIVYFHPDELPPHYGAGGIDYEKEGFGPIIKTIDKLVDELISRMKNECKNDKKYIERANKFFIYDDFNSCERIYKETMEFLKNR